MVQTLPLVLNRLCLVHNQIPKWKSPSAQLEMWDSNLGWELGLSHKKSLQKKKKTLQEPGNRLNEEAGRMPVLGKQEQA